MGHSVTNNNKNEKKKLFRNVKTRCDELKPFLKFAACLSFVNKTHFSKFAPYINDNIIYS